MIGKFSILNYYIEELILDKITILNGEIKPNFFMSQRLFLIFFLYY